MNNLRGKISDQELEQLQDLMDFFGAKTKIGMMKKLIGWAHQKLF